MIFKTRSRQEIEQELARLQSVHPSEATRIAFLERSLNETLNLILLIEELTRLVPITVGIAKNTVASSIMDQERAEKLATRIKS